MCIPFQFNYLISLKQELLVAWDEGRRDWEHQSENKNIVLFYQFNLGDGCVGLGWAGRRMLDSPHKCKMCPAFGLNLSLQISTLNTFVCI